MENLEIYNALANVPTEAKRDIQAGRLKGKTDINPMWRIKALTEQFGACGIGWKYEVVKFWLENGAKDEISGFCQINLYFKNGDVWSEPIPGIGGSSFVALETKGLYTSDECFKMALTDAISVACKALGVAASVYWDKDPTKYSHHDENPDKPPQPVVPKYIDKVQQAKFQAEVLRTGGSVGVTVKYLAEKFPKDAPKSIQTVKPHQYDWIMASLKKKATKVVSAND
jgi:hypothetical protein